MATPEALLPTDLPGTYLTLPEPAIMPPRARHRRDDHASQDDVGTGLNGITLRSYFARSSLGRLRISTLILALRIVSW